MSRPMTSAELSMIMKRVSKDFNPFSARMNPIGESITTIKYVHPNYDNRTGTWFSIELRTMGGASNVFHTQNECRDLKESLFERVNTFLDGLEA